MKQQSQQKAERKALAEQLNATEDAGKREELKRRVIELANSERNQRFHRVTSIGADFVGLTYKGETDDARQGARELCIPVWSITSVSRRTRE